MIKSEREKPMDFQHFVDGVDMPCCVMSVQKTAEDTCGEIRIIAANRRYKKTMGPVYYDGMLYSELVPQDNKFEDYCYRAAILKQRMHAYVETRALGCWTDQTLIPLRSDREDLGYCQFVFEFTQQAEADRMASVSIDAAEAVIEACIKLVGTDDIQANAGDALTVIMEKTGAKAARIMLVDHEKKAAVVFCDRLAADATPPAERAVISYDLIRTWEAMIGDSNTLIIKNGKDLAELWERNPVWAQSIRDSRVQSLVLSPLRREKTVVGYLYVVNFDFSRAVEVKEIVELMSFFLGSELANHLLVQRLEEISQIDVLTGMKNRRAMKQRIRALTANSPVPPYGVINIDLNGLKIVNDHDGHEAGDRLLIRAGELLGKVFYHDDIFRTGGDEFIVITDGISQETFERKMQRLRRDAEKNGLSFAVGSFWSDGSAEIKSAFRHADEMMYADKKAFYEQYPELRR